jgi:transcriptional regulator with XRE-family HTH domain
MPGELRLGERIRAERERSRASLAKLADMTGLSKSYLVRLETDAASNPSLEVLYRIAEALDTTVADLLGRAPVRIEPNELPIQSSLRAIQSSLRAFADEAGLSTRDLQMLASIRWRKGEEPQTPERWRYVLNSLKMSKQLDDRK